ncbi:MAG: hypothetical protein ABI382_08790 [Nakamurella sp.]
MGSVWIQARAHFAVLTLSDAEIGVHRPALCGCSPPNGAVVLDIAYVLGIIAVFVIIGLVAKGAEKL